MLVERFDAPPMLGVMSEGLVVSELSRLLRMIFGDRTRCTDECE